MDKNLLKQIVIPAIKARETYEAAFTGLNEAEQYLVRLTYTGPDNKPEQLETRIVFPIITEAEDMKLFFYHPRRLKDSSHDKVIETRFIGEAISRFPGKDGLYNIAVVYYDAKQGAAQYRFSVDNRKIDNWRANQGQTHRSWKFRHHREKPEPCVRIIRNVKLKNGSLIKLTGRKDFADPAIIDCIEITPQL